MFPTGSNTSSRRQSVSGVLDHLRSDPGDCSSDDFHSPISGCVVSATRSSNTIHNHFYPGPSSASTQPTPASSSLNILQSEMACQNYSESAWNTYASILFAKGIGYPLWFPEPPNYPPGYDQKGISIGDVGFLTFDGGFDFLFNICLPCDDPINCDAPPAFEPFTYSPQDTRTKLSYSPGDIIMSRRIERKRCSEGSARYSFACHSPEGALLILPNGATRNDFRSPGGVMEYTQRHALSWCEHLIQSRRLGAEQSLYLVTGTEKCDTWCLGAYPNVSEDREMSLEFTPTDVSTGPATRQYSWESSGCVEARTCRVSGEANHLTQCVFIRGCKMSLSRGLYERIFVGGVKIVDIVPPNPRDSEQGGGGPGATWGDFSSWLLIGSGSGSQPKLAESISMSDQVDVDNFPNITEPYHPSNAINKYLLHTIPEAQIAITHDDVWCTLIEEEDTRLPDIPLLQRVVEKYHPMLETGCVFLAPIDQLGIGKDPEVHDEPFSNEYSMHSPTAQADLPYSQVQLLKDVAPEPPQVIMPHAWHQLCTPATTMEHAFVGFNLNRAYDITRQVTKDDAHAIGHGSMTDVFSGTISFGTFQTKVAIKTLRGGSSNLLVIKRRLLREVVIWRRLDHSNVAKFLGVVSNVGAFPGLVSPLLEMKSLTFLLKHPDWHSKQKLVREVALGLGYLHQKWVVHGGLNPDNVLVTASGVAQITDFGFVQIFMPNSVLNVRYTAPELFSILEGVDPTRESDVFSFSMFMLEAICGLGSRYGSMPYNHIASRSRQEAFLMRSILQGIRPLRHRYEPIRDGHWELMRQCWHKYPWQRPCMSDVLYRFDLCDLLL